MENKRLEQEQASGHSTSSGHASKDWKHVKDREEELRSIAPAFQKFEGIHVPIPSAQEWRAFTISLNEKLQSSHIPILRNLRDRITATDSLILQWFWVILALLALAIVAAALAISMQASSLTQKNPVSAHIQAPAHAQVMLHHPMPADEAFIRTQT